MGRRLKQVKMCATCGSTFQPFRKSQMTCSHQCCAIRQVRLHPKQFRMTQAIKARMKEQWGAIAGSLEGLSNLDCYRKGYLRGAHTTKQRIERQMRRTA